MLHWHAMVCVAEDLGRLVHERRRLAHGRVETTHVVVHDDGFFFFFFFAIGICKLRTRENVNVSLSLMLSFPSSSCWRISLGYSS